MLNYTKAVTLNSKAASFRWVALVVLMLGYVLSVFHRITIAIMADRLMQDLNLNALELGVLASIYFYPYAFMQFPIGVISDRIGTRKIVSFMLLLAAAASIAFGLSQSFYWAVVSRLLIGFSVSCVFVPTQKFIASFFPPSSFSTLASLLPVSGMLGSIAATVPLAYLVNSLGWRSVYLILGVFATALGLIAWLIIPEAETSDETTGFSLKELLPSIKTVFSEWGIWPIVTRNFLNYGAFMTFQSLWAGPYLMTVVGTDRVTTGYLLMFLSLGQIITSPFSGLISDRLLRSRKIPVIISSYCVVLFWIPFAFFPQALTPIQIGILFLTNGLLTGMSTGAGLAQMKELYPNKFTGTAIGLGNVFTISGPAVFPILISLVINSQSGGGSIPPETFAISFRYLLVATLLAAIAITFSKETFGRAPRVKDND